MDYLLNKCPRVLWGTGDFETAIKHCDDFWAAYREYHGTHQIYSSYPNELAYTIPLAVHGDEGRGKRRSQTTVVSYEAVLGLKGHRHCNKCRPSTTQEPLENPIPTARLLKPSFKGHSFVQHFPAFIIPGTLDKEVGPLLEKLMGIFGSSLQQLFHHPIEAHGVKWRFAVIGCKADLKWHSNLLFDTWVWTSIYKGWRCHVPPVPRRIARYPGRSCARRCCVGSDGLCIQALVDAKASDVERNRLIKAYVLEKRHRDDGDDWGCGSLKKTWRSNGWPAIRIMDQHWMMTYALILPIELCIKECYPFFNVLSGWCCQTSSNIHSSIASDIKWCCLNTCSHPGSQSGSEGDSFFWEAGGGDNKI